MSFFFRLARRGLLSAILSLSGLAGPQTAGAQSNPAHAGELRPTSLPATMIIASLKGQHITIYDAEGPVLRAPISTGRSGYETPVGIYSVLQKKAEHYSNRYDDAPMPFMQRITWSGIALHAGVLPGFPASHGCIRLPHNIAERLFDKTNLGTRVIVARRQVVPVAISHPLLFPSPRSAAPPEVDVPDEFTSRPLAALARDKAAEANAAERRATEARIEARKKVVEKNRAAKAFRIAQLAKHRAELHGLSAERPPVGGSAEEDVALADTPDVNLAATFAEAATQLEAAKVELQIKTEAAAHATERARAAEADRGIAVDAALEAKRKASPVSIFVSRKTQRLYVRQAFQPLLESPVHINDPDKAIGTHVFTALDFAAPGEGLRWNAVTVHGSDATERPSASGAERRRDDRVVDTATALGFATAALDRVTIPQDVIDRIWEIVAPGSSLIISDEELSPETGPATEFIVLISGEPQGGIERRPRSAAVGSIKERSYGRLFRPSSEGFGPFGW